MSWQDQIDSPYPVLSYSPSPSPPPYPTPPFADYIPSLERDFCSNFTCCGLALPNLHALVEHFEEHHVLVFDSTGRTVYPVSAPSPSSSSSPDPSSPDRTFFHSTTIRSPSPAPPHASLVLPYPASHPQHPFTPTPFSAHAYDRVFASRDHDLNHDFDLDLSLDCSHEPYVYALPPSSFSVPSPTPAPAPVPVPVPIPSFVSAPVSVPAPVPRPGRAKAALLRTSVNIGPNVGTAKRRAYSHAHGSRKREKMYRCPRSGCTKSYLNPNGLKYHVEKGTCKIEAEAGSGRAADALEQ